jgi:hypothetical protein
LTIATRPKTGVRPAFRDKWLGWSFETLPLPLWLVVPGPPRLPTMLRLPSDALGRAGLTIGEHSSRNSEAKSRNWTKNLMGKHKVGSAYVFPKMSMRIILKQEREENSL